MYGLKPVPFDDWNFIINLRAKALRLLTKLETIPQRLKPS
jgi:hypothetical protein